MTDPAAPAPRRSLALMAATTTTVLTGAVLGQLQPVVGPPVRIDPLGGVEAANETTAAVSEANPQEIVAGWNDWRLSGASEIINSGFALSLDSGQTWTDFLLRPPPANQSTVEGDPMTAFDPRTGTIWAGAISFFAGGQSGIYVARKDPGAASFEPAVMAYVGGSDKCWMAAGPRPGMPNTTRLYVGFNLGLIHSDDMGQTWTSPVSLGFGLGFLPRVGPNGELYVAYWDAGSNMLLARSLDGGQTITQHVIAVRLDVWGTQDGSRFPGTFRSPSLVYIDVDKITGTLYAAYFDTTSVSGGNSNVDIYFTKSTDQGTTWDVPVPLALDGFPSGDQFFSWLEVDVDGRLHLVYLDSKNTVQDDNDINAFFDAYYAYSVNGGQTWTPQRLSPTSWNSENDGLDRPTQFIGDYLGMSVAGNRAYPVYIDTTAGDTDTFTNVIVLPVYGDVDGDRVLGFGDLLQMLAAWGPCAVAPCPEDVNGSGAIDFDDLVLLLSRWGISG